MKLSKNFTLEELCVTNSGLTNIPPQEIVASLAALVREVLQPLRDLSGTSIRVNSGYRSLAVNKSVGGVATSQHCKGEAADISGVDNAHLFKLIKEKIVFDQLIWEGGDDDQPAWVHVSYKSQGNRGEILRMINGKYTRI